MEIEKNGCDVGVSTSACYQPCSSVLNTVSYWKPMQIEKNGCDVVVSTSACYQPCGSVLNTL